MGIRYCTKCNGKVSDSRNDCPHCGYTFLAKKTCIDCGEILDINTKECPECGYIFDDNMNKEDSQNSEDNLINIPIESNEESNFNNSSDVILAVFKKKIDESNFLRSVLISLTEDEKSPLDIMSASFGNIEQGEIEGFLATCIANGNYSGLIGIDRKEEYIEQERKYISSGCHYTSGGIDFVEKEGAYHYVDVKKTRIITDWHPYNGLIQNKKHSAILTELEYKIFTKSFDQLFHRSDLNQIHEEMPDTKELPEGFYDKGIALLNDSVRSGVAWPGDHAKDKIYNIDISDYIIYRCVVPTYKIKYNYDNFEYSVECFAYDHISPVKELPCTDSVNSVDGLQVEENNIIKSLEKKYLLPKILASVSGPLALVLLFLLPTLGFIISILFYACLLGLIASIVLAVKNSIDIKKVQKIYNKKKENISYIKYFKLKRELENRGLAQLNEEEKTKLEFSMNIESFDGIDEETVLKSFSSNSQEQILTPSLNTSKCVSNFFNRIKKVGKINKNSREINNKNNKNDNIIKEEQVENREINQSTNTIKSNSNTKNRRFDIAYAKIVLMNVLFLLSSIVFVSLSRNNPLDVYFTMPIQYLSVLVLNVVSIVVELCTIVKLFKGSMTYKQNKLSFKIFLISFGVSIFVLVDTILGFTHCNSWTMGWLTFSFSIAVIILSFICIVYATRKNKNESWEDKKRFKLVAYSVAFIISISSIGAHIYWLNCEKVFINKLTNELTEVNCFGKNMEEFVIPEGVISIDAYAFWNCSRLKNIEIPNSVTSIRYGAFIGCTGLTSITIPNSVTSIGPSAFRDCKSLTSITIPFVGETINGTSNTHFGYIFGASIYGYNYSDVPTSLKEVIITGGTSIGSYAFIDCSSLKRITIPNSVTSIGSNAFSYCDNLRSIEIPSSVTSIGSSAFYNCYNLENVYYNGTIEDWCDITFVDYSFYPIIYAKHFYMLDENNEYYEVTEIVIPD